MEIKSLLVKYKELLDQKKEIEQSLNTIKNLIVEDAEEYLSDPFRKTVEYSNSDCSNTFKVQEADTVRAYSYGALETDFSPPVYNEIVKKTEKLEITGKLAKVILALHAINFELKADNLDELVAELGIKKTILSKLRGDYYSDLEKIIDVLGGKSEEVARAVAIRKIKRDAEAYTKIFGFKTLEEFIEYVRQHFYVEKTTKFEFKDRTE